MQNIFILVLTLSFSAYAQQKKSNPADVLRDVRLVCELSRLGQTLLATPEFKDDKVTVAFRISEMLKVTLKTSEAKAAYEGLSMGDRNSKRDGWRKLAIDNGAKNWDCPSLSEIGG